MQQRSMHPKSRINLPEFPELSYISKFKRPESSLFQCLSIGFLEILIIFKQNSSLLSPIYKSFSQILTQARDYTSQKDLNTDILDNYSKMLNLIYNEKSQSLAYSYLKYYSESNDPNCFICLEYGLRFILAYLLRNTQETESLIINDKNLPDCSKALNSFANSFSITIILIEDSKKKTFKFSSMKKQPNLFIFKDQENFCLMNPAKYLELEKNIQVAFPELYPFVTEYATSNPVINVNKNNLIKAKKENNKKNLKKTPEIEEIIDEKSLGKFFGDKEKLNYPQGNLELEESKGQFIVNEGDEGKNIIINLAIPETFSLICCRIYRFNKSLKRIQAILTLTDLREEFNNFKSSQNIEKKYISVQQIHLYFQLSLPNQDYSLKALQRISQILHKPLKSTKIKKKDFWKFILNLDILPTTDTITKPMLVFVLCHLYALHIQRYELEKGLLNSFIS